MKVKATVSFASLTLSMAENEIKDVPEELARPFLKCNYLVKLDDTPTEQKEVETNEAIRNNAGRRKTKSKN